MKKVDRVQQFIKGGAVIGNVNIRVIAMNGRARRRLHDAPADVACRINELPRRIPAWCCRAMCIARELVCPRFTNSGLIHFVTPEVRTLSQRRFLMMLERIGGFFSQVRSRSRMASWIALRRRW